MTRKQVAQRLGKSIATVRRLEGALQVLLAERAVVGGDALAVVRIGAGLGLAENERLLALIDLIHEELHAVGFALLDLDDLVEVLLLVALAAFGFTLISLSSGVYTYLSSVVEICLTSNGVKKPSLMPSFSE